MSIALSIKQLVKTYDNGFQALKGVDLDVKEGDFFALLGPNGAGKSTTIGVICSLVTKSAGKVSVFGYDIDTQFAEAKKQIGIVPQEFNFSQFETVRTIVVNQAGYYGLKKSIAVERTEKYLKQLGLWDKRDTPARMLSGGMKRRLMIARALIHEPRLLILDEPTAGVDIELRRSMWDFLREINAKGTTIILTTHYLEEAESLCRNVAIIDRGQIVENTSVKALLKTLNKEVFIFDTREALTSVPDVPDYHLILAEEHTLEVEVEKGRSLNELFDGLSQQNVHVVSMRNKANRLEELFVSLVKGSADLADAQEQGVGV
ncbi:ABC transporter ATP-binding protein [Aestuariicella hydrocarbonica]|uniref:ABC transporter ATP-binding protein n=1 Tax=Pseudomaricurvus hydrocarbonicus TaxID=1470433 RepID=A0A9E5JQF8_9GAMM|nr:ABC transporter ATP-binding protein [Aestuariicella hydrocarbonica]NHO64782.1 ABC transporter ATP-binding protein [Aestuariicella hydrocarbonica]